MKSATQCPPVRILSALVDGKLIEPELSSHASHLEECEHCQNTVRTLFPSDSLVKTLRNDAGEQETMSEKISQDLIDALKRIPAMDSDAKLSADGLRRDHGMSLDDLGLSFLTAPQSEDEIGRLGHYRVLKVLGRGGMGAVFLAEDPKLGRKVALKVMLPKIASIPAARDRFLREAKAAASLKNDHIVTVYQVDEINGVPFLAMELLQGESLEDALRAGRRFSVSETIRIACDIARGLSDAHEKGLVHRDVKPGNLWLEQVAEGRLRIKILDFGLARLEVEDIHITEFGTIVGTPAFMAPEQARADRPVDAKADLFSLGCVLYVLCTGDIPFKAETTVGILMALALNTPVTPNQKNDAVPAELSRLTMQLLEKDSTKRPKSARDVVEQLRRIERNLDSVPANTGIVGETLLGISQPGSVSPASVTQPVRKRNGNGLKIATTVVIAALAYIFGEVFLWKTPDGKVVRIESNDPSIMLAFGGGDLKVTGAYDQPVTLKPGKVDLKITKPQPDGTNFEFETDKLVVRKGDQIVLKIEVLDGEVRVVQDGKGMVDSKSLAGSTSLSLESIADVQRRAAMWVLWAGGDVTIESFVDAAQGKTTSAPIVVKAMSELPAEPFALTEVTFLDTRPVDGMGFVHLRNLKYLTSIVVEGEGVGAGVDDAAVENLRDCSRLQYFHTAGCAITDKTLEHLKELPELTSIAIGADPGFNGISDAGLAMLSTFPALQKLSIGGANLTNEGLHHFSDFKHLQGLGLTAINGLTDEGLVHLGDIKTLTGVDVVATGAGDATMKRLSELPNLADLSISYTQVTDQGLEDLQALKGLKMVWVMYTSVTPEAIDRFHAAVPECRIRYGTDQAAIAIDDQGPINWKPLPSGAEQFATLIEAMKRANPGFDGAMIPGLENGRLVGLEFRTDNVTDISPLRELRGLRSLRMIGNNAGQLGVVDLSPLTGLPLAELFVSGNAALSDLSPLKGMRLKELSCDGCPIADLTPLSGMPLRNLGLWTWNASDLTPLKGMPLTRLNIGGNGREMDLSPLTGAPLEFLCLNSTKVSDISALNGMPLAVLLCENTLVSDLSPIRGAKLTEFAGDTSRIIDISMLREMPIVKFFGDVIGRREVDLLRGCESLESINYQPAAPVLLEFSDDPSPRAVSSAFTNSVGMEFVQVPKGRAWLARKLGEEETSTGNETVFEEDFFLGMFEVTQQEWVQVMGSNPGWFARNAEGADAVKILPDDILKRLPVERVSWTDCQQFLKKLNELDSTPGWTYRLPTEAEWQYACRGGPMRDATEAAFEFCTTARTMELTPDDANSQHQPGWNRPCRVGLFPPNPLGLYDMHGNVWEWCNDAAPWRVDPSRFIHGGGWNDPAADCRASHIKQPTEPWTYYDLGLRVARVPAR
jgi:serine/threonine protein kinase/formylglycine-generating enzyme required for sulfatase activity